MVTEVTEGAYIDKARRLTAPGAVTYISANELLAVIAGLLAQLDALVDAVKSERAACAQIALSWREAVFPIDGNGVADAIATAIQARGMKDALAGPGPEAGAACRDCGRPYGDEHGFPDLVVDNATWRRISPSGNEGGLLCPSCLCKRAYDAGIEHAAATFRSGPFCRPEPEGMETTAEIRAHMAYEQSPGSAYHDGDSAEVLALLRDFDRLSAEIASLKAKLAEAEAEKALIGRWARWDGADSTFVGTIQSAHSKRNGKPMVVLEDNRGLQHIYPRGTERLEILDQPPIEREGASIVEAAKEERDACELIALRIRDARELNAADKIAAAIRARGGST